MTIKELQALSTVADMLIEMAQSDKQPQCDFCASLIGGKKELMYDGRKTKYCPFCGRKFGEVSDDE